MLTHPPSVPERPSVLMVDDRPENLLALTAVLEPLDVRLVTAGSGEEALRALLGEDFAVILLDVRMPGMDGYETAEYIRGRERSARTPIIFLTAVSTDMTQVLRGYEAGAVDYVLKPFDPVVLRSKVAVFAELERHRRGRERADELLRRAWESSPTGMVLVDDEGRIVRSNPAFGAVVGPDAPAVGSDLAARFHREDRLALVGLCQRVLVTGDPDTCELRLTAADGDEVPVAAVGAAVRDAQGDMRSVLLQVEDLRPRRAAEAAIERAAAERAARDEAEALAGRLARVAAITDGLDAMVLSEVVQELCRRLHEVLGARGAAVRVVDPGGAVVADAERGSADVAGRALRQALADGAQRDGQGAVVELDRAAPVGERVAQPAAGGLGRPALGVGDDGAAGVDHAHGRAAGVEDLVQPAAQLLDDIVEHHRVEAVGDRRHPREAPGERLGLVSRGALGGRPLERGVGCAPGAQVLDLDEQGARVAVRVAHRRPDHPDRDLVASAAGGAARSSRARRPPSPSRTARPGPPVGRMERRGEGAARAESSPSSAASAGLTGRRPSASTSTAPAGEDSHARRRSSSRGSRPRRWRSSSANTATFDRSTTGSNGLRT